MFDHEIDFAVSFGRLKIGGSILSTCTRVSPCGFRISSGTTVTATAEQCRDHTVLDVSTLCQSLLRSM